MSYFIVELDNKRESETRPMNEEIKKVNPRFSNHTHTEASKKAISETQQKRYEAMRKLIRKGMQQPMTEDRVKQICKETIENYFKKNLIEVKDNNKRPTNINL